MLLNNEFKLEEFRLIKSITNTLIANAPFLKGEREDIESALFLKATECKKKYLSGSKASFTTYLYTALKRKFIDILRYKTRHKRVIETYILSLDEKMGPDSELTIADTISDNRLETNLLETLILKERINTVLNKLSSSQHDIVMLIGEGFKKVEIARLLKKPRTTINYAIKKLLKEFRKEGLDPDWREI